MVDFKAARSSSEYPTFSFSDAERTSVEDALAIGDEEQASGLLKIMGFKLGMRNSAIRVDDISGAGWGTPIIASHEACVPYPGIYVSEGYTLASQYVAANQTASAANETASKIRRQFAEAFLELEGGKEA